MLNATCSNISAISWRPVLVVEEVGVRGENHRPWASYWLVRDSSVVRLLFVRLTGAVGRQSALHKENSGFAAATVRRHVSWLSDFIFYPKPLYKVHNNH